MTPEELAKRQANGFGTQKSGDEHPSTVEKVAMRKLLRERLDDVISPGGDAVLGKLRANSVAMRMTRVDAALQVLDDALTERHKNGNCTTVALEAAKFVINHRFGRPMQSVEVHAATDPELLDQLDRRALLAAADMGAGDDETQG